MDLKLTPEQDLIIGMVRRFVRDEVLPLEQKLDPDADELDEPDRLRLVEKTKEMGLYVVVSDGNKDAPGFAFADDKPILSIDFLNKLLSSAFFIDSGLAPIISIFSFSNIPSLCNSNVTFSAVCPPIVGKIASGFSFFIIL